MATISLDKISKTYPNGFQALRELDLEVAEGEFMILVGPSGCGKTTALRMVAGLEDITSGTLKIGERVMNDVSPRDRDIAMVFQNYALYPHMSVSQNIGFSLTLRGYTKLQIAGRVGGAASMLGLTDWLPQRPGQLSGGQRQRVAMGRAIVREPSAFLMDEPLSNLDAKLRMQMRAEVLRTQRRLGVATLYVTHDQIEAMTMGDRVAVLRSGVLQQCDRPQVLYDRPTNVFVAAFIGSPAMNLFEAVLSEDLGTVKIGSQTLSLPSTVFTERPGLKAYANDKVVVGLRPEDLTVATAAEQPTSIFNADVEIVEALGSEQLVHFTTDARRVRAEGALDNDADDITRSGEGVARLDPRVPVAPGDRVSFAAVLDRMHFFDVATGLAIRT
ncbi:MAG: transporter related [Acidimicrobiaceae bacterium]|nr:transporter related [Acidimicrobiaceae bacterium]